MILPFMDLSEGGQFFDLGMSIPDLVSPEIRNIKAIDIISQSEVVEVMKQMEEKIFNIDEESIRAVKKIIDLDYLVSGNLAKVNEDVEINCSIFKIRTCSLLNNIEISGKNNELLNLIEELENAIITNLKEALLEEIKFSFSTIYCDKIFVINPWEKPELLYTYEDSNFPEINFNISYSRGFTKITEIDKNGNEKRTPQTWGCNSITVYVENIDGYKSEYEIGLELALSKFGAGTKHTRVHSIKSYRDFKEVGSSLLKTEIELLDYDVKDLESESSRLFASTSFRVYHQNGYSDLYDIDYLYDYSIIWVKLRIKVSLR
jgi:hypothetical protein